GWGGFMDYSILLIFYTLILAWGDFSEVLGHGALCHYIVCLKFLYIKGVSPYRFLAFGIYNNVAEVRYFIKGNRGL
ncbi:MAG: hypothetical protein NG784_11280, partial [Candidatus Jettenia sp.]|nr:hypothetical protein [Candidatus Jettenia sp.]